MDSREKDLCNYRLNSALETMETAKWCLENKHYKDAINRCYYAATEKMLKDVGKKLANLQRKRENSDYDDFFIASLEEKEKQLLKSGHFTSANCCRGHFFLLKVCIPSSFPFQG